MATIEIEVLDDHSSSTPSDKGFLKVRRLTLRTHYGDGRASEPYRYDVVDRDALDAVVMALYAVRSDAPDDPFVCLRTALRPPVALRSKRALAVEESPTAVIWELPAGLIERGERGAHAVANTASRETKEETGYDVSPENFRALGAPVFLSPGLCAEKVFVVCAPVDRDATREVTATETVELASITEWVSLSEALARCARGEIEDCKTELTLRRLRDELSAKK